MGRAWLCALLLIGCNREFAISDRPEDVGEFDSDAMGLPPGLDDPEDAVGDPADTEVDTDVADDSAAGVPTADTGDAPLAPFYGLSSDLQWPESGDWDPVNQAFYVGSLSHGHVLEVRTDAAESVFYVDPARTDVQTFGIKADVARRRLFVCARQEGTPFVTWFTWVIDLDTGVRLHEIAMADAGTRAQCRDYAVAADGTAWVTDRAHGWIHRVDPVAGTVTKVIDDPRLEGTTWGLDGLVLTPSEDALLVGIAKNARLLRVDLANTSDIVDIPLTGAADFGLAGGHGLDGFALYQGKLYIAAVNKLVEITPTDATWRAGARAIFEVDPGGVSALAEAEGRLFSINGDPFAWTLSIRPDLPFEIAEITFPLTPAP